MRTIVMLLIAALVLTPTLAHAQMSPEGAWALVVIPCLVYLLAKHIAEKHPASPQTKSESQSSPLPSTAVGSNG